MRGWYLAKYGSLFYRAGPNAHWTPDERFATPFATEELARSALLDYGLEPPAVQFLYRFDEVAFATEVIGRTFGCEFTVVSIDKDKTVGLEMQNPDGSVTSATIALDELNAVVTRGFVTERGAMTRH